MGKLIAAYDLGLNCLMLRYDLRYFNRFPWDREAKDGRGIEKTLHWIIDNLQHLGTEVDGQASRRILQICAELLSRCTEDRFISERAVNNANKRGTCNVTRLWQSMVSISAQAVVGRPYVEPWYRLGRAVARCYLDLLNEDRAQTLPSLQHVFTAIAALPSKKIRRINVICRLAGFGMEAVTSQPLQILRHTLDEILTDLDDIAPLTSVIHKVARFDKELKRCLERESDNRLTVLSDDKGSRAILEGISWEITFHQFHILKSLLEADGEYVTSESILSSGGPIRTGIQSANIRREVLRLPNDIRAHIEIAKGHHGGYRWRGDQGASTPLS